MSRETTKASESWNIFSSLLGLSINPTVLDTDNSLERLDGYSLSSILELFSTFLMSRFLLKKHQAIFSHPLDISQKSGTSTLALYLTVTLRSNSPIMSY